MDFLITEEQEMLRKGARDFFSKELPKEVVKEMAKDEKGYTSDLWKKMADLGWMGLIVPENYDGMGGSFLDLTVLLEEMGRAALPGPFFSTVILGALTIMEAGSDKQKQDVLPKVTSGDIILTLAYAEPEAVESPEFFEVEAKAAADEYSISGTKLFVPNANVADSIIVAAKTDKGITLFLVDTKSAGLDIIPLSTMTGDKQCEVNFSNVKVSKDNVIGEVNKGQEIMEKVMAKAAVAKCAEMLGGANYVLEATIAYSKERVQFGKPIGAFQAIQHHCANMAIDVEGSRYLVMEAAWMIDQGLPCTKEISITKAFVNGACYRIVMLGHQVHGALAFQQEHDMHLYIKQAKLGEVSFGSSAYHKDIVAKEIGL